MDFGSVLTEMTIRRGGSPPRHSPEGFAAGAAPKESPPSITGGFYFDARLDQVHLALDVYPVGGRGQIGLRIRVGSEVWDRDRPESRHEATIEVLSTYARLERFSREIDDLLSGAASEARLHVEHLL